MTRIIEGYALLQPDSTDAGTWQLIEQIEPGEWKRIARGSRANLQPLVDKLTGRTQAEVIVKDLRAQFPASPSWPIPPATATDLPASFFIDETAAKKRARAEMPWTPPEDVITHAEVWKWDRETYLAARERLWQHVHPGRQAPDYSDGEHGRQYSSAAAALMTGTVYDHPALKGG